MNLRQQYEIRVLANNKEISIKEISTEFLISERMARYDVDLINQWLEENGLSEFVYVEDKVVKASEGFAECVNKIFDSTSIDYYENKISSDERVLLILFDICSSSKAIKIKDLMQKYCVSRSTINSDIVCVKRYCSENDIPFNSKRGKGIWISCEEMFRRKYLVRIAKDYANLNKNVQLINFDTYRQWFSVEELELIESILIELDKAYSIRLTDVALEALVIHIALAIQRFDEDSCSVKDDIVVNENSYQLEVARKIVERINTAFSIELPESEANYISVHLGGSSSAFRLEEDRGDHVLEYAVVSLINKVSELTNVDFSYSETLYANLFQHISTSRYRYECGSVMNNPIKDDLIANYPKLYKHTKEAVLELDIPEVLPSTDDEIAYLMLHFAAALYKLKSPKEPINVVVVCATGMGTAEVLKANLLKNFSMNIRGIVARHQLDDFLKKKRVDLVVSTISLESEFDYVLVSPIPKKNEIDNLARVISSMGFECNLKNKYYKMNSLAWKINSALERFPNNDEEDELRKEVMRVLTTTVKKERKYMLSELLTADTIKLNEQCSDWKDAVRSSGRVLKQSGYITEKYIENAINTVEELGPYIVITKGVALPHSTNKEGVLKTGMSLITLENPVVFNNPDNDPVYSVFMLATTDSTSHLAALRDLAEFLSRPEFMKLLVSANDKEEILAYIRVNETNV